MKKLKEQTNLSYIITNLALLISLIGHTQSLDNKENVMIDEIIVKVDNHIILKSELEITYLDYLSRGNLRGNDAKCQILQSLITNKMLVVQSELDSVHVANEEVNNNLNRRMQFMAQQFGSEEKIEKAYGKSIDQIKSEIFDQIKEQLIIQRMQSELTSSIKITPSEVKSFFKKIPKDSLPFFSTEVSVAQIVKKPTPNPLEKNRIKNILIKIREKIINGESTFASMAYQYSQDPGSSPQGGEMPFFGRGELAPEYEATALSLNTGEISMPIETPFGFHIIELITKRGNIFKTRHILMIPKPRESDFEKTKKFLDSLRTQIIMDSISFENAAKEYSEDQLTSSAGGFFQNETGALRISSESLDPNIFFTIDTMKIGTISNAIKFKQQDGSDDYRILYFKEKIPPHKANLQNDYQKIASTALEVKKNDKIIEWYEEAKKNIYIDINETYNFCNNNNP